MHEYLLSDISEFWLMLIYLEAIEKCYDEDTGMLYKPPSLSSDYAETPMELKDFHRQQSNQLYHVLEQALAPGSFTHQGYARPDLCREAQRRVHQGHQV